MRSIAAAFKQNGIRVNAICPGSVETNLINKEYYGKLSSDLATPISKVVEGIEKLINEGNDGFTDANGIELVPEEIYGQAVEISVDKLYFRRQLEFCNESMRRMMEEIET